MLNTARLKSHTSLRPSDRAWLALAAGVVGYELAAPRNELLSEAVDRYLEAHPWITRVTVTAVALHLLNFIPGQLDPIHQIFNLARWTRTRLGV